MFWYEDDIKGLEKKRTELKQEPETLFYGSSSIRIWSDLAADFSDLHPVNLGFGGSTLAACTWFFDRVMSEYKPKRLIVYAGENDLSDGRHPEELFIFFQELTARVTNRFGPLPCYFISLKPSIARWAIVKQFKYTNDLISAEIKLNHPGWYWIDVFNLMLNPDGSLVKENYSADGLHMNEKGYKIWKTAIQNALSVHN